MSSAEAELAFSAARGDRDAAAALLAVVRPGVVRYCRARLGRVSGDYTTADDVAQEVCLAVLASLPRFRDQGRPFSAFVLGIAAHKVADAQRAAVRGRAVTPVDTLVDRPDPTFGPEQQAVATDLARRLSTLLGQLFDAHREIVVLRVAVGLSAQEVGAVLGMSAAAGAGPDSPLWPITRVVYEDRADSRAAQREAEHTIAQAREAVADPGTPMRRGSWMRQPRSSAGCATNGSRSGCAARWRRSAVCSLAWSAVLPRPASPPPRTRAPQRPPQAPAGPCPALAKRRVGIRPASRYPACRCPALCCPACRRPCRRRCPAALPGG